jgi:hypothetical protein
MEDTSGFYLSQDGGLAYGPNFVENKDFQLYRSEKDKYQYPVHGWHWFDSEEEARAFFNLPLTPPPSFDELYGYNNLGEENAGNI